MPHAEVPAVESGPETIMPREHADEICCSPSNSRLSHTIVITTLSIHACRKHGFVPHTLLPALVDLIFNLPLPFDTSGLLCSTSVSPHKPFFLVVVQIHRITIIPRYFTLKRHWRWRCCQAWARCSTSLRLDHSRYPRAPSTI